MRVPFKKLWVIYLTMGFSMALFLVDQVSAFINTQTYGFEAYGWLSALGMKNNTAVVQGQYWRLLSANFLHGGLLHLVFNMFSLYVWGRFVEMIYGHGRTFGIVLGSALGTTALSFACTSANSLGASGIAFGLMGALLAFSKFNRPLYNQFFGGGMTAMVVVNLLYGFFASSVDAFGHLGGLAAGYLMARMLGMLSYKKWDKYSTLALVGYLILVVGSIALGFYRWSL